MRSHMWGVSTQGKSGRTEHVEFTVHFDKGDEHIYQRLVREKRCGEVERIDENNCRFTAEVYDTNEMLPWIRTFTGRIESLACTEPEVTKRFYADLKEMYSIYGGYDDAVQ